MTNLAKYLFFVVLYFALGKIALLLSLPQSFVTVIWPPAGIALAAVVIFGYRLWLCIWIASFLLFLTSSTDAFSLNSLLDQAVPSLIFSTGATLQALLGAFLINQFVKKPHALEKEEDIVKFLFLGGPAASVVLASFIVLILKLSGSVKGNDLLLYWLLAWLSSSLAVLIFTPMMMIFFAQPKGIWRSRRMSVAMPMMIVFAFIVVLFSFIRTQEKQRMVGDFTWESEMIASKIKNHMESYLATLDSLQSFYKSSDTVTKSDFNQFTKELLTHKSIIGFSWNPIVKSADRETFEKAAKNEINSGFKISSSPFENKYNVIKSNKTVSMPVFYVEPYQKNKGIIGIDLSTIEFVNLAFQSALHSNEATLTKPVQIRKGPTEVLAVLPVYANKTSQHEPTGFLVLYINVNNLISRDLESLKNKNLLFSVTDLDIADGSADLFNSVGNNNLKQFNSSQNDIATGNRHWRLTVYRPINSVAFNQVSNIWFIFLGILFFVGLVQIFLLIVTGRETLIKRLVLEKTEDLNKANQQLTNEIIERKKMAEELERSNKELEQFAYIASHDLQEPLRMVASFTQLLEMKYKEKLDDTAKEYIHFAVDGAHRMQNLIDDLLSFSRIGQKDVPKTTVDLNAVCQQILRDCSVLIKENDATVTIEPLPHLYANETQMTQLFLNLISNGIKYKAERSPQINVSCRQISDHEWQFSISDNGIGIDEKYFSKLFIIFKRLHTKQEYKGTGIGLALCKKIVENYQGHIWVESKINIGTTFHFTLRSETP